MCFISINLKSKLIVASNISFQSSKKNININLVDLKHVLFPSNNYSFFLI